MAVPRGDVNLAKQMASEFKSSGGKAGQRGRSSNLGGGNNPGQGGSSAGYGGGGYSGVGYSGAPLATNFNAQQGQVQGLRAQQGQAASAVLGLPPRNRASIQPVGDKRSGPSPASRSYGLAGSQYASPAMNQTRDQDQRIVRDTQPKADVSQAAAPKVYRGYYMDEQGPLEPNTTTGGSAAEVNLLEVSPRDVSPLQVRPQEVNPSAHVNPPYRGFYQDDDNLAPKVCKTENTARDTTVGGTGLGGDLVKADTSTTAGTVGGIPGNSGHSDKTAQELFDLYRRCAMDVKAEEEEEEEEEEL